MSIEDWATWLIRIAAVSQTLFVILYGGFSPWWRNRVGRALFTKAFALMLLLDISLINQWIGHPYPLMEQIAIAVIGLVTVGAVMQLSALVLEKLRPTESQAFGSIRGPSIEESP